jgi:N-acetyl-gamma-glutamyl-phosphate reductase
MGPLPPDGAGHQPVVNWIADECMVMHMTYSVAVVGATGYAGGEVLRLLVGHPEMTVDRVTAGASAGTLLGVHHPHLRSLADRVVEPTDASALAEHDVVVLALPHGASGQIAAELDRIGSDALVVDLGADHRLVDPADWVEYYGSEHAGTWTYGMPELVRSAGSLQRDQIAGARRIAVPGCNVTAVTLALQPGIVSGLVSADDVVAVLAVGYSGAGKAMKPHLTAAEGIGSAAPYAVAGAHRHIPEIAQNLRAMGAQTVRVSFTPVLVPLSRGILATVTVPVAEGVTTADAQTIWRDTYAAEPFVEVLPDGQWPTTAMVTGANTAVVQVAIDAKARRLVAVAAVDNLVKGTAGAAVQSINRALGLPETAGLAREGVAP